MTNLHDLSAARVVLTALGFSAQFTLVSDEWQYHMVYMTYALRIATSQIF